MIHRTEGSASAAAIAEVGPSVYEMASASTETREPGPSERHDEWHAPRSSSAAELAVVADDRDEVPEKPAPQQPAVSNHQVTRPQAVQRPRQVILEWSQPPAGAEQPATGRNHQRHCAAPAAR